MAYAAIYRGLGHSCRSVISIKMHSSSFFAIMLLREVFPVDLLRVFEAPYYEMPSEGLLSLHPRLQIHCIVDVNTCRKRPDYKTIVFCRSLQILT